MSRSSPHAVALALAEFAEEPVALDDGLRPRPAALAPSATPAVEPAARASTELRQPALAWFNDLYERSYRPLWAYVLRAAGDASLADDVVQEAFVRVLQTPRRVRDRGPLEPYLYRVASNLLRDHWRRRGRDLRLGEALARREAVGGGARRPRDDALERAHALEVTFAQLKPRERALLWLAHVDGYSHREIASILRLRPLSVRVLLSRARARLAALLTSDGPSGAGRTR